MRRSGASFAISANGTATTAAGRAASSSLVTVIVTPAADATDDSAAAATHRLAPLIASPMICWPALRVNLRNRDVRVHHRPEGPLRIADRVEQQRPVGARHGKGVEPGA